jgi:hypothetical protein
MQSPRVSGRDPLVLFRYNNNKNRNSGIARLGFDALDDAYSLSNHAGCLL